MVSVIFLSNMQVMTILTITARRYNLVGVTRRKHQAVPIAIGTWYFSQKAVTSKTLTERSERHGLQGPPSLKLRWVISVWRTFCRLSVSSDWRRRNPASSGAKSVTTCPAFLEKAGNNLPILSVL